MSYLVAIGEGLAEITVGPQPEQPTLSIGGDAPNICVMAIRLGTPVRLVGRVGDDELGRRLAAFWAAEGIDITGLRTDSSAATGLYVNEVDGDGRHRFSYWRDGSAGSRLEPTDLHPHLLDGAAMVVLTGVTLAISPSSSATARAAVSVARRNGIGVACVLNHRPALGGDPGELAEVARLSRIVTGSTEDLKLIFGTVEAGLDALERSVIAEGGEVAITDGSRPATAYSAEVRVSQPVPPAKVTDAAGAGDAFAGAYLSHRLQGGPISHALAHGVAAGTLSVEQRGCASSYPTGDAVEGFAGALPDQEPLGTKRQPA